jgi:hypothetical protein
VEHHEAVKVVDSDTTRRERARRWVAEQLRRHELWVAFGVFTAVAAVAYVAGYRDGAAR